jgi:hypothetical protein
MCGLDVHMVMCLLMGWLVNNQDQRPIINLQHIPLIVIQPPLVFFCFFFFFLFFGLLFRPCRLLFNFAMIIIFHSFFHAFVDCSFFLSSFLLLLSFLFFMLSCSLSLSLFSGLIVGSGIVQVRHAHSSSQLLTRRDDRLGHCVESIGAVGQETWVRGLGAGPRSRLKRRSIVCVCVCVCACVYVCAFVALSPAS